MSNTWKQLALATLTVGAFWVGLPTAVEATAHADTTASVSIPGDDNNDGVVDEDESGWYCVDMGNRTCGPDNPWGVPAGQYDEGGVLVTPWSQMQR